MGTITEKLEIPAKDCNTGASARSTRLVAGFSHRRGPRLGRNSTRIQRLKPDASINLRASRKNSTEPKGAGETVQRAALCWVLSLALRGSLSGRDCLPSLVGAIPVWPGRIRIDSAKRGSLTTAQPELRHRSVLAIRRTLAKNQRHTRPVGKTVYGVPHLFRAKPCENTHIPGLQFAASL